MSNEKQKDDKAPKPKKAEGAESTELDNESLDGVSGGMAGLRPALPDFGSAGLPTVEKDGCISSQ
jgi:hypothetical protein